MSGSLKVGLPRLDRGLDGEGLGLAGRVGSTSSGGPAVSCMDGGLSYLTEDLGSKEKKALGSNYKCAVPHRKDE
jgi:hypothetical protein